MVTYEDVVRMEPHPQWRRPVVLIGKNSHSVLCDFSGGSRFEKREFPLSHESIVSAHAYTLTSF